MDGIIRFFFPYGDPLQSCIARLVGLFVLLVFFGMICFGGVIFANNGAIP